MPEPLPCPYEDWTSDPSQPMPKQVAGFLEHFEAQHAEQIPPPVRELLKACAKELSEKVPV